MFLAPGDAMAAGCEVLGDPRERAECVARQEAREAARAEVQRQADDSSGGLAEATTQPRSAAWQAAIEDAEGVDAGVLLEPRPIAAIVGLAWFALVARSRWRARRRTHPG